MTDEAPLSEPDLDFLWNIVETDDLYSEVEKNKLRVTISKPEIHSPNGILACIDKLETYKHEPSESTDPRIREGWKVLQNCFYNNWQDALSQSNAVVVVYGSTIYSDPRNLDFDIELILDNVPIQPFRILYASKMHSNIENDWSALGGTEGHISVENFNDIFLWIDTIKRRTYTAKTSSLRAYDMLSSLEHFLTGNTELSYRDPVEIQLIRTTLLEEVLADPILRILVAQDLDDVLNIREKRASGDFSV